MTAPATLEIHLSHLDHNYTSLKSKLKTSTKFMAIVKAFGYGSEEIAISKHLEFLGVDYFAVAFSHEGVALRNQGIQTPILVLHPTADACEEIIKYKLEPAIYNAFILKAFLSASIECLQYPIHIKANTGLNRLGFSRKEIKDVLLSLKQQSQLAVKSIYSHLAASEDLSQRNFTLSQISLFKEMIQDSREIIGENFLTHILNTSGILNYLKEGEFDMVRSGIGLHGYSNDLKAHRILRPLSTLKTKISQIHSLKKGDSIGYNRAYVAKTDVTIAILPIGHADGIDRIYGKEKGYVSIQGHKAPIIGNVCMDMILVEVHKISAKEGDEVIIFGEKSSAETLAEDVGTISYELITGIGPRVKRLILRD